MRIEPLVEEVPAVPDAGLGALRTGRGNLPLEFVEIHAAVRGLSAEVAMTQGFRNPFDVPLEATYVFPLPDRAAVTALRMEAAGHVVEGVLKEREQARADYDAALAAGRRAALAEEERPDVFTMSVGNILPGERVTVRLTFGQPLPYEDGEATLRFPLVVAPRYIPGAPLDGEPAGAGTAPDTDAVPDASRISPPVLLPGFPHPVRLALSVDVDPAGLALSGMRSSLHTVTTDGRTLQVRPGERLDRDFVLRLRYAAGASCAVSGETFTLTVVPPAPAAPVRPRDVVVVLDRSGSMGGWKMVAARRAAARVVDTLRGGEAAGRGDRFAVLSFDHVVERALPGGGLAEATDRDRYRAVEHLARLEARGGTEMLAPLREAVSLLSEAAPGRDKVLVLVTDGQVGNEDQILAHLPAGGIRVHTIGIDRAVNAGFLGRLAAAGAGRCELVESEDRLDEVMEHVHRRITAPAVTGVSIDVPGMVAGTLAPARPGDLFPGVPLVVRGRRTGTASGPATVRGVAADGSPWERRLEPVHVADPAASAIWARAHLRDLEDRYAAGAADADLVRRIVGTSLAQGVLCRFTAFVAVDSRVAADGRPSHRVIQPVEPPSGWHLPGAAPETAARGVVAGYGAPAGGALPAPGGAPPPVPAPAAGGFVRPERMPARGAARRLRPMSAGAPGTAPAMDVRAQVAEELERLRATRPTSEIERRQILADLGSRLDVLCPGPFTGLVAALRSCDDPAGPRGEALDRLWRRTLRELAAFTEADADAGTITGPERITGAGAEPRGRRRFWQQRPR